MHLTSRYFVNMLIFNSILQDDDGNPILIILDQVDSYMKQVDREQMKGIRSLAENAFFFSCKRFIIVLVVTEASNAERLLRLNYNAKIRLIGGSHPCRFKRVFEGDVDRLTGDPEERKLVKPLADVCHLIGPAVEALMALRCGSGNEEALAISENDGMNWKRFE